MEIDGFRKLLVWQKADELAVQIYLSTKGFPKEEIYGLTSQLRRAALSIPANLAEGSGRQNKGETRQHANVALGSLKETSYFLDFSHRIGFLKKEEYQKLKNLQKEVGALLWKFYVSL